MKRASLMANPPKRRLTMITIMFLIAGVWGIFMGLFFFNKPNFILTALGMVNISLAIFLGFRVLKKEAKQTGKRK